MSVFFYCGSVGRQTEHWRVVILIRNHDCELSKGGQWRVSSVCDADVECVALPVERRVESVMKIDVLEREIPELLA